MKAFPTLADNGHSNTQDGMDLRDYFAAHALTGAQIWDAVLNGKNSVLAGNGAPMLAQIAYAVADEMMKARKQ